MRYPDARDQELRSTKQVLIRAGYEEAELVAHSARVSLETTLLELNGIEDCVTDLETVLSCLLPPEVETVDKVQSIPDELSASTLVNTISAITWRLGDVKQRIGRIVRRVQV